MGRWIRCYRPCPATVGELRTFGTFHEDTFCMNREEPLGTLTPDDLLVLFEWAHRFCETGKLAFSHHAEAVVIDRIAGDLERVLKEPFRASYPAELAAARTRLLEGYEARMGRNT